MSEESLEETSQRTAVGDAAEQEKEKNKEEDAPIWIEWDSPTDPGNPFNVSSRFPSLRDLRFCRPIDVLHYALLLN